MSATTQNLVSQRRQKFLKSIRNLEHSQFKQKKRQTLCNYLNPPAEVYRLKGQLVMYNIQYFPREIVEIINVIERFITDQQFCLELKASYLMEDLFEVVIGQLKRKPYIEAVKATEMLVSVTYELLTHTEYFSRFVQQNLNYLIYALYRYPLNNRIASNVSAFILFAEKHFSSEWKTIYFNNKLVDEQDLIPLLIKNYLWRKQYETYWGQSDFMETRRVGEEKWYKNGSAILEVINSLMMIGNLTKNDVLETNVVRQGLYLGMKIYYEQSLQESNFFEEQVSDLDSVSDSTHYSNNYEKQKHEGPQHYFISLVLDLYLLRSDLLNEFQTQILLNILKMVLHYQNSYPYLNPITHKILRKLYEEVILNDQDLNQIAKANPSVTSFVEFLIHDFI